MNLLDAAYNLLKSTGIPMTSKEMIGAILKAGLWSSTGKTPDASLSAQIYMDIKKNGSNSRFVNVGEGRFALSGVVTPVKPAEENLHEQVKSGGPQSFSFTDCAERVLQDQQKHRPLHYRELTDIALSKGWLETTGKTPAATMYAQIIQEIQRLRKRGEMPRFVQCGKGYVALTVWDKTGVDFQIRQHHEDVRKKLKARLMALEPDEFEELVSKLLQKMGFREVAQTRFSKDGGIDVRGKMITIGSGRTEFAIQVKRWKHNVQAPIVQQVRGSLGAHEQGCIITTSDFSSGAREEANKSDKAPIALVDGKELINLLIEHEIGVRREMVPLFEVRENLLDDSECEEI